MRAENSGFRVVCKDDKAEIFLYDVIGEGFFGGVSAKQFAREFRKAEASRQIDLRINSPGGDVFDGVAMYSLLQASKANISVFVDGFAASIASVIAMAGDSIEIAFNGSMMIHDPWAMVMGNAAEMRKEADLLDQVKSQLVATYAARTGIAAEDIAAMMTTETWMTGQQAMEKGFADSVSAEKAMAACFDPKLFRFKRMPAALLEPEPPDRTPNAVLLKIEDIRRRKEIA